MSGGFSWRAVWTKKPDDVENGEETRLGHGRDTLDRIYMSKMVASEVAVPPPPSSLLPRQDSLNKTTHAHYLFATAGCWARHSP